MACYLNHILFHFSTEYVPIKERIIHHGRKSMPAFCSSKANVNDEQN